MLKNILALSLVFGAHCALAMEFKIGVQVPLTGKSANEGQGIRNVVQLLVDQKNAAGGINGEKLVVISCDDEASPQKAVVCAKTLINDGVKVVIGSFTSTATTASQGLYAKAGIIQTSDATAASMLQKKYPTYFRNSFNDNIEGLYTANYFIKVKKYKRIAILSDYSVFALGLSDAVSKDIKALGGNIVYQEKLNANNQDFKAILTDIKSKNPDVIYYSGYYTEGALLRAQQVELGIKADFIGGNSNGNIEFAKIAGTSAAGSYLISLPIPTTLDNNLARALNKDYIAKYKSEIPSIWSVTSADGLLVVFAAMQATKSDDPKVLAKYIHGSIKELPCYTGTITIDVNGERMGTLYQVSQIQNNLQYLQIYK